MKKLTELRGAPVVDENGVRLGRVWEVRCEAHRIDPAESPIAAVLCGWRGLLERLGFRAMSLRRIGWESVARIEDGKVIVHRSSPAANGDRP